MEITITKMEVADEGGWTDVVQRVYFTAVDEVTKATFPSYCSLGSVDPQTFQSFSSLTKEQVTQWILARVPPGFLQRGLELAARVPQEKPLPW